MKKFIIILLGVLFLSASMNAAAAHDTLHSQDATDYYYSVRSSGSYCVDLPGHDVGNSGWTKRDNHVGAKWKFGVSKHRANGPFEVIDTLRGNWEGEAVPNKYLYGIDYIWYSRGDRAICIDYKRLTRDLSVKHRSSIDIWLWLDVKYGKDCPKLKLFIEDGRHTRMTITKRSGDLVNPWVCRGGENYDPSRQVDQ